MRKICFYINVLHSVLQGNIAWAAAGRNRAKLEEMKARLAGRYASAKVTQISQCLLAPNVDHLQVLEKSESALDSKDFFCRAYRSLLPTPQTPLLWRAWPGRQAVCSL